MSERLQSVVQHISPPPSKMFHNLGVIFIIGGGPRIGYAVAETYGQQGYKVCIGSRNPDKDHIQKKGWFPIEMDLSNDNAVPKGFEEVRARVGEPNVVVYNAAALTWAEENDAFSIDSQQFQKDLQINVTAAYAAMNETVKSFKQLENSGNPSRGLPRAFIATGNVVPFQPMQAAFTLGSGKAALVHLIQVGNEAYRRRGFRFYWASQVTKDGGPVPNEDVDAKAHGEKYLELTKRKELGEWDVRFV